MDRVRQDYAAYANSRRRRSAWAADNRGNAAIRAELLELTWRLAGARLESGGTLLDAGCGTGFWLRALLARGVSSDRLHGVDLLPERLALCRRDLPARLDLRHADVRALPYPDAAFDVVLVFAVLSSLPGRMDVRHALSECRRVTRPGGLVLVYEPRYPNPLNRRTRHVSVRSVEDELGRVEQHRLTVWPPLARRMGRLAGRMYPALAGRRWATSHWLLAHRRPPATG